MKNKILLAMLFSAFFTFNGFAKTYKVIAVRGTVNLIYGTKPITLTYGKTFTATITPSELRFVTANASITFAETVRGAQPQTANCNSTNCQPNAFFAGAVVGGNRRDELDAFLMDDKAQLSDITAAAFHNEGLQLMTQQNAASYKSAQFKDAQFKDAGLYKTQTGTKLAPVQALPQMNKAVQRQR